MRTFQLRLFSAAALLVLATALTACSTPTPAPAPAPANGSGQPAAQQPAPGGQQPAQQTIKRGGTWVSTSSASWAGSDPAMGQAAYQNWLWFATWPLRRQPDNWKLDGDAIEKWEFSPDGMELTLHVRKGMKWQNKPPVNGREIEARDLVYTLRSITGDQYPDLPSIRFPRRSNLEDMASAEVVDKYTVKVKMKHPSSTFLDGLAEYRSPLHPDQIREHFGGRDSLATPHPDRYLSAGPFTMDKYTDLTEAILNRYPDYWEKGADGQSKPYLDRVHMIWVTDTSAQVAAFIAGQVHSVSLGTPETRDQILSARKDAQVVEHQPNSCWNHITFNTTRKPFDDVRVRKAIVMALDEAEIGRTLRGDFNGKPVWRYSGPLPWSFPESLTQDELKNHPLWESPTSQKTIDEAKKLMADAGFSEGFAFQFMTYTGAQDALALYVDQIQRVFPNLNITQNPVDNAIQLERAAKGDFDVRAYCYIHEPTAVAHAKTVYHSKGGRNFSRYADPKMDELLDKASMELDEEKRNGLLREAQLRAMEIFTFWPTYHGVSQTAFLPEARGMRLGGATNGLPMYLKEVWLDE